MVLVSLLLFARPGFTQGNPRCSALELEPSTQTKFLSAHPNDLERIKCMLDFYARRLNWPDLRPYRMSLIRWVIAHHPDIREGYLDQGLDVSTEAGTDYSEVRTLWHQQVERTPDNSAVLSNAGRALIITDREEALQWLKRARKLSPEDWIISQRLADLYAYAIMGVVSTGSDLGPNRVDSKEEQSTFAKLALQEAQEDSVVAAMTGMKLHYTSRWPFFRTRQLDYDKLAETLLLKAATLDYPRPTKISALGDFYSDQQSNTSERVESAAPTVERTADKMIERITTPEILETGNARPSLAVRVKIVVGVDGHVWSASSIDPPSKQSGLMAASKARSLSFLPLRVGGQPVRVGTELTVKVEELKESAVTHLRVD